jgi:hypothetical protein
MILSSITCSLTLRTEFSVSAAMLTVIPRSDFSYLPAAHEASSMAVNNEAVIVLDFMYELDIFSFKGRRWSNE